MTRLLAASSIVMLALAGPALAQSAGSNGAMGTSPSASHATEAPGAAMSASQVKEAQNALKAQGLYKGQVDGIMGPRTKAAITAFQKKEGLRQSASLDQETYNRLMSMNGSPGGSSTNESGSSMAPGDGQSGGATTGGEQNGGMSGGEQNGGGSAAPAAPGGEQH